MTVEGVHADKATRSGMHVTGGTVSLNEVWITDTQIDTDGARGRGVFVDSGANLTAERIVVERSFAVGIVGFDPGTTLNISDVVVRDTKERPSDSMLGSGIEIYNGASLTLARALLERNHFSGIYVAGDDDAAPSTLHASDLVVRNTLPESSDHGFGRGAYAMGATHVSITRGVFDANSDVQISATGYTLGGKTLRTSTIQLTDVVAQDTLPTESTKQGGKGLTAEQRNHD